MLIKDINYETKYYDIQNKKEELLDLEKEDSEYKVKKIIYKKDKLFILINTELIIINSYNDVIQFERIRLEDDCEVYDVYYFSDYIYLINKTFIIKYYCKKDFSNKWKEFKLNEEIIVIKIKLYKKNLILRCSQKLIIFCLENFKEVLNLDINEPQYKKDRKKNIFNLYNISIFKNFLVYLEIENIIIINWENRFSKETIEFNTGFSQDYLIFKNYFINFIAFNTIFNIRDIENKKNFEIKEYISNQNLKLKKQKNLLFIFSDLKLIITDMDKYVIKARIDLSQNEILNIIFLRNLIIYEDYKNNLLVIDYVNSCKEIFNLNINSNKKDKEFLKLNNNNLLYIQEKKLKIYEFKNNFNIFSKDKIYNYKYKNFWIIVKYDILIYDAKNNNKLIYEKKLTESFNMNNNFIYKNYLIVNHNTEIIILNLDNLEDIKEKNYYSEIKFFYNIGDILYILFYDYATKVLYNYIEIINIINFENKKKLEFKEGIIHIEIYNNNLFAFYLESIDIFKINNNNLNKIKSIEILINYNYGIDFKIEKNILIINLNSNNISFINIENNFEIINFKNKEDLKREFHIFKDLIIFYDRFVFNVYKKIKNNYELNKLNYLDTTKLESINNYLFIVKNNEIVKIVMYENNNFNILKELKTKSLWFYLFNNLLYLTNVNILTIYNIDNNFEEIKQIEFKKNITDIKYDENFLIVKTGWLNSCKLNLNLNINKKIYLDGISYQYYLKFENMKNELDIDLKTINDFYKEENILDNSILFNYIFKINLNIIKYTENPKLLSYSLNIFGIDKLFSDIKCEFNLINQIISSFKINIFLEPLLNFYIKNNHLYEINYLQFLNILKKINDKSLFSKFIEYIFQRTVIPREYEKVKYISIDKINKIISLKNLYFDNNLINKIYNNSSNNNIEKKEFEIYNIPFKISESISENFKLFEILEKSPNFIKYSNIKYLVYYFFNKTKYFKYFNIIMYLLLILSITINLVSQNSILVIFYLISIIYFLFYEIMQFWNDYRSYFKYLINWFDILLIIYNIVIFIYIYLGLFKSINWIIMVLYYLNGYKLINFLKSIDWIRKEIRLFINVIKKTYSFIIFILIILMYFTNLNFLFNFNNFNKFNWSFFNVYGQMLGNFDDNFNEYKFYDYLELLINTYSFNIILLNLFISIISKVFDDYNDNLELYDIQEKINLLQEFSSVYFIIDYVNKIVFKLNNHKKYYFFIFEKNKEGIDLIKINEKLIHLESNIKSEVKSEVEEVRSEVKEIKSEVKEVRSEVKEVRSEVKEVKSDVKEIKSEVKEIRSEVKEVKNSLNSLESDIKNFITEFSKK